GITINKNSNNRLHVDTPIVSSFSLENNGLEVGSFYVNVDGQSLLKTDVLRVGYYQYSEQSITVNGTTYYVLARV
ncbi:MAG: hypothetical protein II453_03350, partial [Alphaproteobacteria bacterium]|nr:hypothetical protein [Alphaproteobacteria bacterium]